MDQYTAFYQDDRFNALHRAMLEDIRHDVRKATLRRLRRDVLKTLLWWAVFPTLFYAATRDNALIRTDVPLPLLLSIYAVLVLIPLVHLRMWEYRCLRGERGKVVACNTEYALVPNVHRNVGYVNHLGDLMRVSVLVVKLVNEKGSQKKLRLVGNQLHALGCGYYREGDVIERFDGARYPYNCNPERRLFRSLCLHCGYLGSPNEERCAQCGCTMLRFMPAVSAQAEIGEEQT